MKDELNRILESHHEVMNGLSENEISDLLNVLVRAYNEERRLFFTAAGRTNLIIRTFAMRLMQIGFQTFVVFDTNTPAILGNDLLIIASGSGETETTLTIARKAKEIGAETILFSKEYSTELAKFTDHIIRIPSEARKEKLQTKGSEFEQVLFILCDMVSVHLVMKLNLIKSIGEIDEFIKIRHANLQ